MSSQNIAPHIRAYQNQVPKMPTAVFLLASFCLCAIIVVANFTVQFQILASPLTFGALTYPFSFLLLDILSERHSKKETMRVLAFALVLALYPSYLCASGQIALASIAAFCLSQPLDVLLFYALKRAAPRIWWLRAGSSTLVAQFVDTLIFFTIAFWGIHALSHSLTMAVADFMVKAVLSLANVPLFYLLAIAPLRRTH